MDIDCERLVFRLRAHNDGAILAATDEELEELIGFVAAAGRPCRACATA